jgi:hypothetical protein
MADLTEARVATDRKLSPLDMPHELPRTASSVHFAGGMVGVDASGNALRASAADCVKVVGRGCKDIAAADAATTVKAESGIFLYANATAGAALADTDRFMPCYVLDDQTVTNDNAGLFAGLVYDVDSAGVWVMQAPWLTA